MTPAAPHPSVGCLGGPVLRLRRTTTRDSLVSRMCCGSYRYPNPSRIHPCFAGTVNPGWSSAYARRAGALPPTRKKKALRFAPALLFFFLRLPPAGCHLHRWLRPHRSFFHTLRSPRKKIDGTPSRARPAPGAARGACPPPQMQPPRTSLRYGIAGGGSIWGGSPAQAPACAFVVFFKRQLYV